MAEKLKKFNTSGIIFFKKFVRIMGGTRERER